MRGLEAPLNILTNAKAPSIDELARLGVARLSLGSGPYLAALTAFRDLARNVRERGTVTAPVDALTYAEVDGFFR